MPLYTYELIGGNGDHIFFDNRSFAILADGLSGLSGYPVTYATIAPVGQIGEINASQTIGKRTISFTVAILGNGRAELESKRQRLVSALNPLNTDCKFIWNREDRTTLWCMCRVDDGSPAFSSGTPHNAHIWTCDIDLIAADPCWYSGTTINAELRGFIGGFSLPFSLPVNFGGVGTTLDIVNTGDTPTPCEITLRGYLKDPVITNISTGEQITVRRTIQSGEKLVINTTPGKRSVILENLSTGTRTNALSYTTIGSSFFSIPSGAVKVMYSTTDEGSGAGGYISFTPRWLSV